jgi:hypothetical protein
MTERGESTPPNRAVAPQRILFRWECRCRQPPVLLATYDARGRVHIKARDRYWHVQGIVQTVCPRCGSEHALDLRPGSRSGIPGAASPPRLTTRNPSPSPREGTGFRMLFGGLRRGGAVIRSRHQSRMLRRRGCHRGRLSEQRRAALRRAPNPVSFVIALLVSMLLLVSPALPVAAQDASLLPALRLAPPGRRERPDQPPRVHVAS